MIEVTQLSKWFPSQPVLYRISFSVEEGQSYVILGQSGIGKSVLLKTLARLIEPDEGFAEIKTRNLGMVFQKNALFDSLSVFENLDFTLRERSKESAAERRKKIQMYLDWVELGNTAKLMPNELSGGMQKRLAIARALIVEPQVVLYDEPTAGLDPITSRLIADLILRLKKETRSTIVTVTSDVLRAFQLADRIGLLVRGVDGASLLDIGAPEQARLSGDARVQQFLKGQTQGPLTDQHEAPYELARRHHYKDTWSGDLF
jgi:phospholipid/cholesterol/gamma-HCH transport system ATP-binding protein